MHRTIIAFLGLCLGLTASSWAPGVAADSDQPLTVAIKRLTLESAMRVARAAIDACREEGVQIAVTVVDRGGNAQVVLRDVLAPDVTLDVSLKKAYTAMAFVTATSALEGRFTNPFSVGKVDALVMSAGGVPIEAGGMLYGGVGVSGAPSGEIDEACARAGVRAIADDLELDG